MGALIAARVDAHSADMSKHHSAYIIASARYNSARTTDDLPTTWTTIERIWISIRGLQTGASAHEAMSERDHCHSCDEVECNNNTGGCPTSCGKVTSLTK